MARFFIILIAFSFLSFGYAKSAFQLKDTNPNSPQSRARFLGSYGVNSSIEPEITPKDRSLYKTILPHLNSNPEKAIKLAIKDKDSKNTAAFDFLVGNLYYTLQDYTQAEHYLKQAIEKFPDFRRAHRNLSLIHVLNNDYINAIPHLLKVIQLGGGDGQSYSMLGYSYLNQEKYQSALSAYHMARMFFPDSTDVRRGEAQCLLMTNQLDSAIALINELIAESPTDADLWLLQANNYLAQERFDEAIANLEIAHTLSPPTWETHKLLADLYLSQNLAKNALENYQAALTINPNISPEFAFQPLRLLVEHNRYTEATHYLKTLDETLKMPLSQDLSTERAIIVAQLEIENNNSADAIRRLKRILETDPLNGDALLILADCNFKENAFAEAEFYFERAVNIPETKVKAFIGLARTAVQQERFSQAINYLKRAQRIQPRNDIKQYIASIENALSAQN